MKFDGKTTTSIADTKAQMLVQVGLETQLGATVVRNGNVIISYTVVQGREVVRSCKAIQ